MIPLTEGFLHSMNCFNRLYAKGNLGVLDEDMIKHLETKEVIYLFI